MADRNELTTLLRSNRMLSSVCWAQAALIGILAIAGWTSQRGEVRLSRLAIVDSEGRERVVLRGGADGQGLVLLDSQGRVRAGLTVDSDRAGLRYYDPAQGHALAGFVVNPDGATLDFLKPEGGYTARYPGRKK